ncbi:MAG: hypothetical protein ACLP0J_21810 [Solirubrobacteraceae bacterium]
MLSRHPLYYYVGDKRQGRAGQTLGQGITSFGGTWHVIQAGLVTCRAMRIRFRGSRFLHARRTEHPDDAASTGAVPNPHPH